MEAMQKATGKVDGDGSAFTNALRRAKEKNLTLIFDEAHTLFSSGTLYTDYRPRVLLFSASGDAATASNVSQATPNEITQKFMWTPPLPFTPELKTQLEDSVASSWTRRASCGGHRGIFIAAMHWVKSMQNGEGWEFDRTVELVRCSHGNGDWKTDTEILAFVRQSRAVRINGRFNALEQIPREFAELLCKGATSIATFGESLPSTALYFPNMTDALRESSKNWIGTTHT